MKTRPSSRSFLPFAVVWRSPRSGSGRCVPPESPSGSLAFLSAAPSLPIFDRAGRKIDLTKEKGTTDGHPLLGHVVPAVRRGDPGAVALLGPVPQRVDIVALHDLRRQGLEDDRRVQQEEPEQTCRSTATPMRRRQAVRNHPVPGDLHRQHGRARDLPGPGRRRLERPGGAERIEQLLALVRRQRVRSSDVSRQASGEAGRSGPPRASSFASRPAPCRLTVPPASATETTPPRRRRERGFRPRERRTDRAASRDR